MKCLNCPRIASARGVCNACRTQQRRDKVPEAELVKAGKLLPSKKVKNGRGFRVEVIK